MADEMDAETAALIEQLMLDDMEVIAAGGTLGGGDQRPQPPFNDFWVGNDADSASLRNRPEDGSNMESDGEPEQAGYSNETANDVSNEATKNDSASMINVENAAKSSRSNEQSVDLINNEIQQAEFVENISEQIDEEPTRITAAAKGKGKAVANPQDGKIVESQSKNAENLAEQREIDRNSGGEDDTSNPGHGDPYYCSDTGKYHPPQPKHPDDWLFEPCTRVWNPTLQTSELHATIPWSFIAATFGIIVDEEDDGGNHRRRGRSNLPWDHRGNTGADVTVHEIRLDPLEG